MKAPHPVFRAAMCLDGLGQAMLSGQPVALSGLALTEMAAVLYTAATEIRELRAQAEAEAAAKSENAVLRAFVEAFADEDGCGCGYSDELLKAYGAAYELMWPETALAQAGGEG